ncbi:MAG: GNAT family N-acetyltransferase [Methanobacteriota archaeon]|nr:MAG: GNAT family N-acetyltransferase [Euryarchaeota archaeon]
MVASKKIEEPRRVHIGIRDGTEEDLERVVDLWEELVKHHSAYSDHFTLARDGRKKWAKYLNEKFSEPSTRLIVAEENDDLVGFMLCLLNPGKPIFKEKAVGVISDAYVVKHRRRKGIMKEMLSVALRWFSKNRIRAVEVSVSIANQEARDAWNQLGFRPFMERKRLQLDDGSAIALMDGDHAGSRRKVVRRRRRG